MTSINLLHSNDRKGVFPASWYAAITGAPASRPAFSGSAEFDVCIIGGGLTGLSAALHLSRAGYDVAVLEAHRVGWGASGRNGGQVGTGQRLDQDYLEKHYGRDNAHRYWEVAEEAKALVRKLAGSSRFECNVEAGILHADHKPRYVAESRDYAEKLNAEYGYDKVRFVDRQELRQLVRSESYFGGTLDMGAFHLNPLALTFGIAEQAEDAGAVLFENSEVLSVTEGNQIKVKTRQGEIRAGHLLYACNGYLGMLQKGIAERVLPINNFVIVTEPLTPAQRDAILPSPAAVADSKFVINYFRMTHDNRLLFGGGENYGYRFPADIKAFVRKPMLEIFPQAEPLKIDFGWGGTLAVTVKRLPLFQRVRGNILACTGYSGHGVALATLAGKIAAEAVDGQASRFDLMADLDTPRFPGGTLLRYPMLVAAMTWFSLRDRL
ncbi:NAD(P)/FAD-dependent oxidoreductase [Salaquimonas pukyongi]|uniref:NAD(P)/FAD-dependent oxidoreductase n=1 Tax=Salaquimonas pukyongi TaxID=2712698 RepID=UPI00096B9BC9|nr:FAD-binding oxidoreductase [Salaquimonas pukyongi]